MAFENNNFDIVKKEKLNKGDFTVDGSVAVANASKVLAISSDACVNSYEVLNGTINYSGTIEVCILYMTDDGCVETAKENIAFTSKFDDERITIGQKAIIRVKVIDSEVSLTSSDSVRIAITLEQSGQLISCQEISSIRTNDENICYKEEKISIIKFIGEGNEIFSSTGEVFARGGVKKILLTESQVLVKNVESGVNFVSVSGDVVSRVLYLTDDDKFESSYIYDSFKQEVELDGVTRDSLVEAYASIRKDSLNTSVEESEKGTKIVVTSPVSLTVKAYMPATVSVIKDLYSTANELKVNTTSFDMTAVCMCEVVEGKIDGSLTLEEDKPRIDKLIFVGGNSVAVSNSYIKDGEVVIEGIAKTNAVYLNDETNNLNSVQIEVPFVISDKFNHEDVDGIMVVDVVLCDVDVVAKKGRELYYDAKVRATVNYCHNVVSGVICEATTLDAYPEKDFAMELLFAEEGKDAWEVAKEAKVNENLLIAQNPNVIFPLVEDTTLVLYYQKI